MGLLRKAFVAATKEKRGFKAKGGGWGRWSHELKGLPLPYNGIFGHENGALMTQNESFWEDTT